MNASLLKRLRDLFRNEFADKRLQRRNIREWIRARRMLGADWVLYNKYPPGKS